MFFVILNRIFKKIYSEMGYTFKNFEKFEQYCNDFETTLSKHKDTLYHCQYHDMREKGIPLPFLANKIVVIKEKLVCVPYNVEKLGASLVLPGVSPKVPESKLFMERLIGVAFSGGWVDEKFYNFCRDTYESLYKTEANNSDSFSEVSENVYKEVKEVIKYISTSNYPSRELLFDMNALNKDEFVTKYLSGSYVPPRTDQTTIVGKNEIDDDDDNVLNIFKSVSNISNLTPLLTSPKVIDKNMGHSNAKNVDEQNAKMLKQEARWKLERQKSKTKIFVSKFVRSTKEQTRMNQFLNDVETYEEIVEYVQELADDYGFVDEYIDVERTISNSSSEIFDKAQDYLTGEDDEEFENQNNNDNSNSYKMTKLDVKSANLEAFMDESNAKYYV